MRKTNQAQGFLSGPGARLALVLWLAALGLAGACAKPVSEKKPDAPEPRHVYRDLKPEVVPLPEGVKTALPGLLNDNIYLQREIAPTANLVAYVPSYSRDGAIKMAAAAFTAMADIATLRSGIEFWIIQIQPQPTPAPTVAPGQTPPAAAKAQVVVWGVRPTEVDAYLASGDLAAFLQNSEYLLVDDVIIAKGELRLREIPGLIPPAPLPGTTAAPVPPGTLPPPVAPMVPGQITPPSLPGATPAPGTVPAPKPGATTEKPSPEEPQSPAPGPPPESAFPPIPSVPEPYSPAPGATENEPQ